MKIYKINDSIGGEFKVLGILGGGMGVVYVVNNRELLQPIVLKTYQEGQLKSQFLQEARAWVRAGSHTNIVQAFWAREIDGQVFVAAEYVRPDENGRSNLAQYLASGRLAPEIVLMWSTQFCRGMTYTLMKNLKAHRDIKPENLLISTEANLKVTDFGLSMYLQSELKEQKEKTVSSFETSHSLKGTLPYMAPEQFESTRGVDHRADIYSFGVVLYQMITGNHYPYKIDFRSQNAPLEFYRAHLEQKPILINSPFMPIVAKCLQKNPEQRYSDYDDLYQAFEAVGKRMGFQTPRTTHVVKEDEELYAQAQSYSAFGEKDKALAAIDEYLQKYPDNYVGWTEKGVIHYARKEYQAAIASTRKSLELNPYNSHAWNNLGIGLKHVGAPFVEIKAAFVNALRLDPGNNAAMIGFVGPLVENNELSDATALVVKAFSLAPAKTLIADAADFLLKRLFSGKQFHLAKRLLQAWTGAQPLTANAWHNLGLIYLLEKDHRKARESFKRVLEISPDDHFAHQKLRELDAE
ncbi:MAG: protein kinase [Anaerolineales bacterium]|nr:MAG: protein kinase [Anaerolineales bacterium]